MENLIKQTRARFFGSRQEDNKEESSSTRDRKIPPQRTQSSREKKRGQSWIRRQFSRQMSWDYDFSAVDYPTAVAAAAYAVHSLEESKTRDQEDTTYGPDKSLSKTKSKVEDIRAPPEPLKSALKSSDGTSKASFKDPDSKKPEKAPSLKKKISFADTDETTGKKPERPVQEKAPERALSVEKHPSFVDKELDIIDDKTPQTVTQPPTGFTTQPPETRKLHGATQPETADSKADAWEKEELASVRDRYGKLKATIENWESKKKKKAKQKIERTEAGLDNKRVKSLKSYNAEIARIEGIAGGARAQAEKNRRNEELKVIEKANKIRLTGKIPATCLCF